MTGHADFQNVLNANLSIEAVFRFSRDGLALNGGARNGGQVDEVVSIAAGLFSYAVESGLVRDDEKARLLIEAGHGSLFVKAEPDKTLLLVLTKGQHTERQIEEMVGTID
jgi:hypothetical protein